MRIVEDTQWHMADLTVADVFVRAGDVCRPDGAWLLGSTAFVNCAPWERERAAPVIDIDERGVRVLVP